jgi:hypothetical protein
MCSSRRTAVVLRKARPRDRQRFLCGLSRLHSTETDLSRACWMGRPIGRPLSTVFCDREGSSPCYLISSTFANLRLGRGLRSFLEAAKERPIGFLRHSSPRPDERARGALPTILGVPLSYQCDISRCSPRCPLHVDFVEEPPVLVPALGFVAMSARQVPGFPPHVAKMGAGSGMSFASFRRFWAVAARRNSSLAPFGRRPLASALRPLNCREIVGAGNPGWFAPTSGGA